MKSLEQQILALKALVPDLEKTNPAVSAASVGWHGEHCLLVLQRFVQLLSQSDPQQYQPRFSWRRWVMLGLGRFPRGKAKAPKQVIPEPSIQADRFLQQAAAAETALQALSDLPEAAFMPHPIFGHLRKKTAIRFARIHTQHHLNIIRDILAA